MHNFLRFFTIRSHHIIYVYVSDTRKRFPPPRIRPDTPLPGNWFSYRTRPTFFFFYVSLFLPCSLPVPENKKKNSLDDGIGSGPRHRNYKIYCRAPDDRTDSADLLTLGAVDRNVKKLFLTCLVCVVTVLLPLTGI